MSETGNIAKMAKKLLNEIFSIFNMENGWFQKYKLGLHKS